MAYPPCPRWHCRSDGSTVPADTFIDISRLRLVDDLVPPHVCRRDRQRLHWLERKRKRRCPAGSRSVSGRSSDRSATRRTRRCCSVGDGGGRGAYATCSDFLVAAGGTDSSGEMSMNGDGNWGSYASKNKVSKKEAENVDGFVKKDGPGLSQGSVGIHDLLGNESGYGSETGYKGDAEVGYEDEFEEEEDDGRLFFWGDRLRDVHALRPSLVNEARRNLRVQ